MIKKLILKILLKLRLISPSYYIGGAQNLPEPLTAEEERKLISGSDPDKNDKLIVHNLRLVVYIAKKFDSGSNIEDLISIGTIGLIKAVNTFHADRNIKLATYASRCIENEILMYLRKTSPLKNEISIDEPLNTDQSGNELLLSDILGSDPDEVGRGIESEDERVMIKKFVSGLPARERQIMEMRFGMNGYNEYTQKQVADTLGISQSYISRLEKRIIDKLKRQLEKAECG